jgi:hypothetical protein
MEDILSTIVQHWPFLAATLFFAFLVQTLKGTLYTKQNIVKYKKSKPVLGEVLWWMRKTLPLHPAVYGWLLGYVPGIPASPGVEAIAAKCLYFAFAGIASTWIFGILKSIAKKRGIELKLPNEEE